MLPNIQLDAHLYSHAIGMASRALKNTELEALRLRYRGFCTTAEVAQRIGAARSEADRLFCRAVEKVKARVSIYASNQSHRRPR